MIYFNGTANIKAAEYKNRLDQLLFLKDISDFIGVGVFRTKIIFLVSRTYIAPKFNMIKSHEMFLKMCFLPTYRLVILKFIGCHNIKGVLFISPMFSEFLATRNSIIQNVSFDVVSKKSIMS